MLKARLKERVCYVVKTEFWLMSFVLPRLLAIGLARGSVGVTARRHGTWPCLRKEAVCLRKIEEFVYVVMKEFG